MEVFPQDVSLNVLRFGNRKKAETQGQRDLFHVKSLYFDRKFHAVFYLSQEEEADASSGITITGAAAPPSLQCVSGCGEALPTLALTPGRRRRSCLSPLSGLTLVLRGGTAARWWQHELHPLHDVVSVTRRLTLPGPPQALLRQSRGAAAQRARRLTRLPPLTYTARATQQWRTSCVRATRRCGAKPPPSYPTAMQKLRIVRVGVWHGATENGP